MKPFGARAYKIMVSLKLKDQTLLRFYVLLVAAAIFVWITGRTLPNIVASHFDMLGQANGFMPRSIYLGFMYALIVIVPLVLAIFLDVARIDRDQHLPLMKHGT